MTNDQDPPSPPDDLNVKKQRRRTRIYADRLTVSLRIEPDMHRRMMELCIELKCPANTYLLSLIEADLRKRHK